MVTHEKVNQKYRNDQIVLNAIKTCSGRATLPKLTQMTGFSGAGVSGMCKRLIEAGFVRQMGKHRSLYYEAILVADAKPEEVRTIIWTALTKYDPGTYELRLSLDRKHFIATLDGQERRVVWSRMDQQEAVKKLYEICDNQTEDTIPEDMQMTDTIEEGDKKE